IAASLLGGCFVRTTQDESTPASRPVYTAPSLPTSSTFLVGEMSASLSAQSDGQSIKIYAGVFSKNGQAIVLENGDYFTAQLPGAEAIVLTREQGTKDDVAHYAGTLPVQPAAVDVIIALNRPAGKAPAPASKLHLPAPFQITSTAPATTHRGDLLPIQITPASGAHLMELTVDGECLDKTRSALSTFIGFGSDGTTSFDTANLTLTSGASSCDISLNVRAQTSGEIDPAFAGGVGGGLDDAEGLQQRSFSTTLVP
ncbi:MAG: hypothetical protein ABIP89_03625, partial [Polyangiaceae bacterium]